MSRIMRDYAVNAADHGKISVPSAGGTRKAVGEIFVKIPVAMQIGARWRMGMAVVVASCAPICASLATSPGRRR